MPTIQVGTDTFNIAIDGPDKAPVLMLSNSLGTSLGMWDQQIPHWSKSFRVVRYDSRGHGGSAAPARPYSIAELGRDALGIMDALGLAEVNWCGLSKGGMVGMWLLTHAPQRIRRAVLANTAARMGPPDLWNTRIRMAGEQGMAPIAEANRTRWFSAGFNASASPDIERVLNLVRAQPAHGYAGCCAAIRDMDQREAIRAIDRPVMVIIGAVDPATPPAAGDLIASSIRGARKTVLDAAHLSNIEQPEKFAATVAEFLA
jgi:3-oxoadipate enol-lactonase